MWFLSLCQNAAMAIPPYTRAETLVVPIHRDKTIIIMDVFRAPKHAAQTAKQ